MVGAARDGFEEGRWVDRGLGVGGFCSWGGGGDPLPLSLPFPTELVGGGWGRPGRGSVAVPHDDQGAVHLAPPLQVPGVPPAVPGLRRVE